MSDHILLAIIVATFTGSALSLICAAGTLAQDRRWVARLIAFAVGALLGAVFLEILPHALEAASPHRVLTATLIGILFFFVLEKFVLWRHSHNEDGIAVNDRKFNPALFARLADGGGLALIQRCRASRP
jgi:zinc transporter ZupT